jgi:YjbE family integral membrane protein
MTDMGYDMLAADLTAFASVVVIDVVLAGDNALVVGLVASRLPRAQQRRVVTLGIAIALACRIAFAVGVSELLQVTGLLIAGGLLLLWVAWKLWRELAAARAIAGLPEPPGAVPTKSFGAAVWQIAVADVSMSLDNVLGVAGAAHDHVWMLIFGLALSVSLMGVAATLIAGFMERHSWLGYLGLAVIAYVALSMIYAGAHEVWPAVSIFGHTI